MCTYVLSYVCGLYVYIYIYVYAYIYVTIYIYIGASMVAQMVRNLPAVQEIQVWIQSLLEKGVTTCKHSCLEILMDIGAWWAIVYSIAKSGTWLNDSHYMYIREDCLKSQCITERHDLMSQAFLYRSTHIQPLDSFLLLSMAGESKK